MNVINVSRLAHGMNWARSAVMVAVYCVLQGITALTGSVIGAVLGFVSSAGGPFLPRVIGIGLVTGIIGALGWILIWAGRKWLCGCQRLSSRAFMSTGIVVTVYTLLNLAFIGAVAALAASMGAIIPAAIGLVLCVLLGWLGLRLARRLALAPRVLSGPDLKGVFGLEPFAERHATPEALRNYRRARLRAIAIACAIGALIQLLLGLPVAVAARNDQGFIAFYQFTGTAASVVGSMIALAVLRRARSKFVRRVWDQKRAGGEPFTLFLRSFADDSTLKAKGPSFRPDGYGSPLVPFWRPTLEEIITDGLWKFGPVVAIGKPGEASPTPGAAREYVPEKEWRERVHQLAAEARAIVVICGQTSGLAWEMKSLLERQHADKLVLVLPGKRESQAEARARFLMEAAELPGDSIPTQIDSMAVVAILGAGTPSPLLTRGCADSTASLTWVLLSPLIRSGAGAWQPHMSSLAFSRRGLPSRLAKWRRPVCWTSVVTPQP
jgi:hypothetical protein